MQTKDLTFDIKHCAWTDGTVKLQLDSGQIVEYWRIGADYVVKERVLVGYKKSFLDGVEIFTSNGCRIAKMYRIRNNEWSKTSSLDIVHKALFEFLWTDKNRESMYKSLDLMYSDYAALNYGSSTIVTLTKFIDEVTKPQ